MVHYRIHNSPPPDPILSLINSRPRETFRSFQSVVSLWPNLQTGGPPLVGCSRLLQYIRNYAPYLQAVPPIRNLRTRHVVVTGTHG